MKTTTVIIGAGHSGLAMSRRLSERSIDHVVLERGCVANSWRTERWESLTLLTPNWQTRLPGMSYTGPDPDGFMTATDVAGFIAEYATAIGAPVQTETTVTRLGATASGYEVVTDRGVWTCESVVIASGGANLANVPACATDVPESITTITPIEYRSPGDLAPSGVLVVGASASGVQLADEISRSGRSVTLSVGEHVRLPRCYRGRDIFWWLDRAGIQDERFDQLDDLSRARHLPSPQLIGSPERRSIDLNSLQDSGVEVVGRLGRIRDGVAQFSGSLSNTCALADLKMNRLLDRLDEWARGHRVDDVAAPHRFEPTRRPSSAALTCDLARSGIGTIVWATGYRADHCWLDLPVLDHKGRIRHTGGVVDGAPGVYLLGASVLRRRRSSYINGADADTFDLARHLEHRLASG